MGKLLSLLFCISFFVTVWSQSFNLNVSNGFGTGTYNEGDTIYIWANPNFQNYSFTSWQGSATNYMLESNEWLTRIIVPQNSNVGTINASSQFVDLSSNVITGNETISLPGMNNGIQVPTTKEIYYRIPQNPIGVIFCFHGTGGSGAGFENDFEKKSFFKAGANRNYIMIATEANEKTHGDQDGNAKLRWEINNPLSDNAANNIDIKLIEALKDTIFNRLNLPVDFPTFSLGVSNGANFSDLCAAALQFNASGHMTGNGFYDIYANRPDATPVIFVQSENDQHESANPTMVINNHNALISRGISSELHWHKKTPVYPDRFIRTTDLLVSPENSDSIYQRMLNTPSLLDSDNKLLIQDNSQLPNNLFSGLGLSSGSITDCENQIKIMNADHKFHSHYNNRIIDFFEFHLSNEASVLSNEAISNILIYPSPTTGLIYLSGINSSADITVINSTGEALIGHIKDKTIDLTPFPDGVYFIRITSSDRSEIKLVIKGA